MLWELIVAKQNPASLIQAVRTAIAAVVSLLIARMCRLPESYWAAITTLIVMQSTLGAALPISAQRLVGTAVGAIAGAVAGMWFAGSVPAFGVGVFVIGALCAALRFERSTYRYAGITLAVVLLIPHSETVWVVAIHRFFEISIGIAVGLAITAVWPERGKTTTAPATRSPALRVDDV